MYMTNHLRFMLSWVVLSFLFSCSTVDQQKNMADNSIEGVWEYIEDDVLQEVNGMSFFSEKHFAFVINFKMDSSRSGQKILAHSGVYSIQDSLVTATIQYSHNPAYIGQKIRWIHNVNEEIASYKVLDKTGRVVESGKVRRLE